MQKNNPTNTASFIKNFEPSLVISSPGRINFIGEHTDYNNGFVLPTAIDKVITFSFRKNNTKDRCNVYSKTFDKMLEIDLQKVAPSSEEWENYILGVIHELQENDSKVSGFDCTIESNLPLGSGISSSAALECGLAYGLNELFSLGLSKLEMVKMSQRAEHNYVGTKCGIMDQYAVMMSEEHKVILLDCAVIEHEMIPANFGDYHIVLLNTNVSHNLATSAYNDRVAECAAVITTVAKKYPEVRSLRDVTLSMLEEFITTLTAVQYQRAVYVISENTRVLEAVKLLKNNDLDAFGVLMYASHNGLQNQYEVSCKELDFLVDFSKGYNNVIGARMMGGGFGGCTINLVHKDHIEGYVTAAEEAYKAQFDIDLTSFIAAPSAGTHIVEH